MASPVGRPHKRHSSLVHWWLTEYERATPGVEALGEGTVILGPEDEPEPDASLQIRSEYGGRTQEKNNFQIGAPELVVEVAYSSAALDLHLKKSRYEQAGADEYLVVLLHGQDVRWFALQGGRYAPLPPDEDGILRSRRFPGLWLDPQALPRGDPARLKEVLGEGLASPEHAAWVAALAVAAKQPPSSG